MSSNTPSLFWILATKNNIFDGDNIDIYVVVVLLLLDV